MTGINRAEAELERERRVVGDLYARLDALTLDTEQRLDQVRMQDVGGNHQARSERDAFARLHEDRLTQLRDVDARLVFGRLLLENANGAAPAGDPPASAGPGDAVRYVGRIGLRDDDQHTVLVDWRAPQASAFYQATAGTPMGVRARRHLTMHDRDVVRIDDEVFDPTLLTGRVGASGADASGAGASGIDTGEAGEGESAASRAEAGEVAASAGEADIVIQGEGALLAALTTQRTGHMHDIVATIQAEQDRIIRADIRRALVVQGGPGTGKTAVALHRAAYLLYANRERLSKSGVLVVGPSSAFLRYIEAVLPSLGETGVVMQTLGGLFPGVDAMDDDAPEIAKVKGAPAMARLIAQAVRSRQRVPAEVQTVNVNADRLRVHPQLIARAIQRAQRSGKPHNTARVTFVRQALDDLTTQLADQLRASGSTIDDADRADLREDLRTAPDVRVLLNTAWLPLSAEKLIRDLYARPEWLASLTPRWTPGQRSLLARPRDAAFTISDVPLLDEAAELLGDAPDGPDAAAQLRKQQRKRDIENAKNAIRNMEVKGLVSAAQLADNFAESTGRASTAERAATDRSWTYGHIVVDEAQELSPMQWRLLVRRDPMRSFTIVGDIAQASSAAGATSWAGALQPLFGENWRLEELTVNYRTPAQITREAEAFARAHGLPVTPTRAVREGDWPIRVVETGVRAGAGAGAEEDGADGAAVLVGATVEAVRADLAVNDTGTLAVIAPVALVDAAFDALDDVFDGGVGRGAAGLGRAIAVLTAREAKGLEFDAVVLTDPDAIVAESPRGASALYVAMTRPTQRLTLVRA
ncbi:HelD family protein [Rathayibacter soli]|uniref:HelD family protein n=1 Tax=Rathayibacter soli TaxID=3144168 RepID=UPI0027E5A1FC|nr:UvrD-helicase domain-containing protein [Glaciibacter superstes]